MHGDGNNYDIDFESQAVSKPWGLYITIAALSVLTLAAISFAIGLSFTYHNTERTAKSQLPVLRAQLDENNKAIQETTEERDSLLSDHAEQLARWEELSGLYKEQGRELSTLRNRLLATQRLQQDTPIEPASVVYQEYDSENELFGIVESFSTFTANIPKELSIAGISNALVTAPIEQAIENERIRIASDSKFYIDLDIIRLNIIGDSDVLITYLRVWVEFPSEAIQKQSLAILHYYYTYDVTEYDFEQNTGDMSDLQQLLLRQVRSLVELLVSDIKE